MARGRFEPGFQLAGSPIRIVSQMPDVAPGATPVLFGNLKAAYTPVDKKAVTIPRIRIALASAIFFHSKPESGAARLVRTPALADRIM